MLLSRDRVMQREYLLVRVELFSLLLASSSRARLPIIAQCDTEKEKDREREIGGGDGAAGGRESCKYHDQRRTPRLSRAQRPLQKSRAFGSTHASRFETLLAARCARRRASRREMALPGANRTADTRVRAIQGLRAAWVAEAQRRIDAR
jgi:hypothetical protein